MRLGIMQPYFFPYLGHFALIASVDEWIVFDVTQYTPKTWMNRNRVLHPKSGPMYVSVPLANSSNSIKTSEAMVLNMDEAKRSIAGKLSHYKRKAPYYYRVQKIIQEAFDGARDSSLVSLNVSALVTVCEYLGIPFRYRICSELSLDFPEKLGPGDWAPFICNALGATEYVNPVGGKDLFDVSKFSDIGVKLLLAEFSEFQYSTDPYVYEPNLSILDAMMWNAPEEIVAALQQNTRLIDQKL